MQRLEHVLSESLRTVHEYFGKYVIFSTCVLSVCPSLKCSDRMQLFGYEFIWDDAKRPPNKAQMVVSWDDLFLDVQH